MELLTVYLIRWFTIDSVEELAKEKGGKKAVKFDQSTRQFIGVGNATGLGMAPFLLKHPALIHNWVVAKETALARVRSIETALPGTLEVFLKSLLQASQHIDEWNVADEVQSARIDCLTDEIQSLRMWCEDESNIFRPYPWNGIYQFVEDNFSLECQEMIVSLIISVAGFFFFFSKIGLSFTYLGLILAHTALGTPFVVITVTATLTGFDTNLIRASQSLGADTMRTFFKVIMPLILPGVISGGLFAFITSFDEVVVVMFVGSVEQITIPKQMWAGLRQETSPVSYTHRTLPTKA